VNIPYVQNKITHVATKELSVMLGVPVKIDQIGIKWINRLTLEGVYLEDQAGLPLLEANHISAGFELLPLLQGKFVFTTARIFGFSAFLKKDHPKDELNIRFLIDAFSSKDTLKKSQDIDLRINSVLLRKGHIRYDVNSEPQTTDKFNPKHIDIDNVSANISLKAFNKDSVNAHIKRLSFTEATGFTLDKLTMNIVSNRDSAYIDNFEILLPQTQLKIDRAKINIKEVEGLTTLFNNAPIDLNIAPSQICLHDLSAFIPAFSHFNDVVELSAEASGYINDIDMKHLTIRQKEDLFFNGRMELKGITQPGETYVFGKVNRFFVTTNGLHKLANNFNKQPIRLPAPVVQLGTVNFSGEISGFFDNLVAFGELSSSIGSLQTDMIFGSNKEKNIAAYVRGHIASSELDLNTLFGENTPYGKARFSVSLDTSRPINGNFMGKIDGEINEFDFKDYRYENIVLAGNFQQNGFDGTILIDDPNGALMAVGMFEHKGEKSVFNFTADLKNFHPDKLNLIDKYDSPEISLSLKADFTGNNIDNLEGNIRVDSFSFKTQPSDFFLNKLEINASGYSDNRRLTISSDILNGEVVGAYSFNTIVPSLMNTIENYLPTLIRTTQKKEQTKENNFSILLNIGNTEALSQTLKLPITITEQANITGLYNNRYNKFKLDADFPEFLIGKSLMEGTHLSVENPDDKVNIHLETTNYNSKNVENKIEFLADAGSDRINTLVKWKNDKKQRFSADFSASAVFQEENTEGKPELRTDISIHESPIYVNDSLWRLNPSLVTIQKERIDIDNFMVDHGQQHIYLNGTVSRNVQDTLLLDLKEIELSYIFETLGIPVLQFGGEATGSFFINDLYETRVISTKEFEVQNFSFNQVDLGRLSLYSEWDDGQQGILMVGSIYKNDSTFTDVDGYIFPVKPKEGLSLRFNANDIDISFLQPFLKNVATNVKGRGFGFVHLYGPFRELTIEGDTYVEDGGLGIDFLNTYYTFSDSVHMDAASIKLKDVSIFDKFGNSGKVNLTFNHKYFRDYDFHADIQANKMLMYDQSERNSPMIYGNVFGSGTGTIRGNEKVIDFDINVKSEPKTQVGFNFMTNSASSEYDFITFVDKDLPLTESDTLSEKSLRRRARLIPDEGAELRMNFLVDVTPDASIELIIDPTAGDKIKGKASGSLQVQYGTKSDLRMYGGMNIVEGNYNFSLQQIIHKDFKIRDGSTINFQGDPYNANMSINAIYNLTANLSDLDQGIAMESARSSIPVNCVLILDGMLRNPTISFNIELPGSNEELERQVRSFIDTDDMMTRQIVYLLVLNRFYTPDYSSNSYSSSEWNAVASSAISAQLSSLLNTITDKVQIGTNIRAAQEGFTEDTEVEMLLSSQLLDNRLILNGNLGYRTNTVQQKNVFVGEFDLEYKLTPSGEFRLKAYNHANDMYQYLKQSLTTQGVGIMFKKDFTHLSELFRRRRKETAIIRTKEDGPVEP